MYKLFPFYIYRLVMLAMALILVACRTNLDEDNLTTEITFSTTQASVTLVPEATQTFEYTLTPTMSPTPILKLTPTPLASQTLTQAPTPTETPIPIAMIKTEIANLRTGPGEVYPIIVSFSKGVSLEILGRNIESTWFFVDFSFDQAGWISIDAVEISGDLSIFAIVEPPPTPVFPTLTPTLSPMGVTIEKYEDSDKIILVWVTGLTQGEKFTVNVISYGTILITRTGKAWSGKGSGNAYLDLRDLPPGTYTITVRSEAGLFAQTSWKITN